MKITNALLIGAAALLMACAPATTTKTDTTSNGGGGGGGGDTDPNNPWESHHDGTWESPVAWTGPSGKVGALSLSDSNMDHSPGHTSFYTVATDAGTTGVLFRISGSSPAHEALGDDDFYQLGLTGPGGLINTYIETGSAFSDSYGLYFADDEIDASSTYGFYLRNKMDEDTTFNLAVVQNPTDLSVGTWDEPVALELGDAGEGEGSVVNYKDGTYGASYFSFTLTSTKLVHISYSSGYADAELATGEFNPAGGDNGYIVDESSYLESGLDPEDPLDAGTYYIKVTPATGVPSRGVVEFSIQVDTESVGPS